MLCEADVKRIVNQRWSARARTYDKSPGHGIHSDHEKRAWLRILDQALDHKKDLSILDVGTGTGALALLLAELGHEVKGVDLSENMLQQARRKAETSRLPIEFKVGDAESPPFEKGSFDAIVCRHLLWTLPDPEKALRSWGDLLKQGGRVVVIDGNFGRHKRTWVQEAWRYAAMPLVLLTEFRDPRMPKKDLDEHLPMRSKERPSADIEMLESLGFNAGFTQVELPRKYSALNYLKYGYSQHSKYQFVVTGINKT